MNDDRGGEGSLIERTSLRPFLVVTVPVPSAGGFNIRKVKNVSLLVQDEEHVYIQNAFCGLGVR